MGRSRKLAGLGPALAIVAVLGAARPACADLPDDKATRIQEYASRSLVLQDATTSYVVQRDGHAMSDPAWTRLGGFNELAKEADAGEAHLRLGDGLFFALGVPIGGFLFYDNFLGQPTAQFRHPSVFAPYPAGDLRSFALSAAFGYVAWLGLNRGAELVADFLGFSHPNLLDVTDVRLAVKDYDRALRGELNLTLADVASGSAAAAAASASAGVDLAPGVPAGVTGSAAAAIRPALRALVQFKGDGYRPYLVFSKGVPNWAGLAPGGEWDVLAYNPTTGDDVQVAVPTRGGTPTLTPAPSGWSDYRREVGLLAGWKTDDPQALAVLQKEFQARGVAFLETGATVVLYPRYGLFANPVWTVLLPSNPGQPTLGVDASSSVLLDLTQGRGALPGSGQTTPGAGGTSSGR